MLVATITEAKNRLSALIDHVRGGEAVLIVDRGIPVARLESAVGVGDDGDGRIARLERQGAVRAAGRPLSRELLSQPPPSARRGASGTQMLLDQRVEGR